MRQRQPTLALINLIQDRYLLKYWQRSLLSSIIKMFIPKPEMHSNLDEASELKKLGYVSLPNIPVQSLAKIRAIAETCDLFDPWSEDFNTFTKANRPEGISTAKIANPALYNEITELAHSSHSIDIASNYFGCKCIVDSVDVWWSFPRDGEALEAENFHRDRDATEFLKWFVYVTDVDEVSGPHEYALDSVKSNKFAKGGRYIDADIYNEFETKKFIGQIGTNFLENTYGLHRGYKPKEKERLLFQVRYSVIGSSFRYRSERNNQNYERKNMRYSYLLK